jgi:hypothetical protein
MNGHAILPAQNKDRHTVICAPRALRNSQDMRLATTLLSFALCVLSLQPAAAELRLSPAQAQKIGQRLWKNECAGTVEGLTSWNKGEDFPSLGIGHFIWYPKGVRQTFQESFPAMIRHLESRGAKAPAWVTAVPHCPWSTRESFLAEKDGARLGGLREYLARTVGLQAEFAALRAREALPKLLAAAPPARRGGLQRQYDAVATTPQGVYALVDYVNFKGEGLNPAERYQGHGWGLLQVLEEMKPVPPGPPAAAEFSAAAKRVLGRRIANAPRAEGQWRAGWFSRCDSYGRPF